jgi:hypothetical protein
MLMTASSGGFLWTLLGAMKDAERFDQPGNFKPLHQDFTPWVNLVSVR